MDFAEQMWERFLMWFCLLGAPVLLTFFHASCLFINRNTPRFRKWRSILEFFTIFLGMFYISGYILLSGIDFQADWTEQLYNSQTHTPIATWTWPAILAFAGVGILGYLILRLVPLRQMPPLVVVAGISCSYAGVLVSVLWCIQIWRKDFLGLTFLPVNCILLLMVQIKNLMFQWREIAQEEKKTFRNPILNKCNEKLQNALTWPVAALVLFVPLFGILIAILILFGQRPDAVIEAFTQTSDWNLSTQEAPQNLYRDEHYLCTVAAGGHRKVVKPLRMGRRHGHPVIVNRQLCVANAFEQILEEKLPKIHRAVRKFYDTYGFPVAKLIHSPFAADVVYVLMKPLEWLFLLVIYFTDVKPENRIAIQYLPPEDQKRLQVLCWPGPNGVR